MEILQKFVAFWEYMNFTNLLLLLSIPNTSWDSRSDNDMRIHKVHFLSKVKTFWFPLWRVPDSLANYLTTTLYFDVSAREEIKWS